MAANPPTTTPRWPPLTIPPGQQTSGRRDAGEATCGLNARSREHGAANLPSGRAALWQKRRFTRSHPGHCRQTPRRRTHRRSRLGICGRPARQPSARQREGWRWGGVGVASIVVRHNPLYRSTAASVFPGRADPAQTLAGMSASAQHRSAKRLSHSKRASRSSGACTSS